MKIKKRLTAAALAVLLAVTALPAALWQRRKMIKNN